MKTKTIKETVVSGLGFELILALDEKGYLVGARTEEGGSYPLLDFEYDKIFWRYTIQKEGRDYSHVQHFGIIP